MIYFFIENEYKDDEEEGNNKQHQLYDSNKIKNILNLQRINGLQLFFSLFNYSENNQNLYIEYCQLLSNVMKQRQNKRIMDENESKRRNDYKKIII